jgi:endonuclease/exonuclease/phosphatase family metal-dependent hydrolase
VSLWRTQSPGDAAAGGTTPATTVAFDFLRILLDDLAQRGLRYEAVRVLDLMDVEAPIATGMDLRLTDRQAILVRSGLPAANARGQAFSPATLMSVSVLGTTRSILRGWTAVDVTIGGRRIAFYDTHLQSFDAGASTAQAGELAGILASEAGPVVLVGDLNSAPGTEGHAAMMAAGFTDAWSTVHPSDAGLTCCWPEDLTQTSPPLHARVDLVLTRGDLTPTSATVVGEELGDRTATHLWPSDHAGVVATIEP